MKEQTRERLRQAIQHASQGDVAKAAELAEQALGDDPESIQALGLVGIYAFQSGDDARGLQALGQAAANRQTPDDTLADLSKCALSRGYAVATGEALSQALELRSASASLLSQLGNAFMDQARQDEALAAYRDALEISPRDRDTNDALLMLLHYIPREEEIDVLQHHTQWFNRHARNRLRLNLSYPNTREPGRTLRIGFISADMRAHSVSFFLWPLLANLDRQQFEIYCYSNVDQPDALTRQYQQLPVAWRDIHDKNDEAAFRMIREDRIDILFDLGGHTPGNRLPLFAQSPAPVQAAWLGYPATTGLPVIQWRLTDAIADPVAHAEDHHSERLIRLARGFLCYDPLTPIPEPDPAPCLKNGYITFGSFNKINKLNDYVVSAWARILDGVPGSRLLLKTRQFIEPASRDSVQRAFAEKGIDPSRLELLQRDDDRDRHLRQYGRMDIALDTFPYNGTTTTCEALLMGVPVVTLKCRRHAGRVTASILHQLGPEYSALGAETLDEYVQKAIDLAGDQQRLKEMRAEGRQRLAASPLSDHKAFARQFAETCRRMWRFWLNPNEGDAVVADPVSGLPKIVDARTGNDPVAAAAEETDSAIHFSTDDTLLEGLDPTTDASQALEATLPQEATSLVAVAEKRLDPDNLPSPFNLNIGGSIQHKDWRIVDSQPGPVVDFVDDLTTLEIVPDESCDTLYACHQLQRFHYSLEGELLKALKSWRRVLKPGSLLFVSVPDIIALAKLFTINNLTLAQRREIVQKVFGDADNTGELQPHYAAFDSETLAAFLTQAGFKQVRKIEKFGIFDDRSTETLMGRPISLNVIAVR